MSLFGTVANLVSSAFGAPPLGTVYDVLDASGGGGGGRSYISPRKGVERVQYAEARTGIGASTLDFSEFGEDILTDMSGGGGSVDFIPIPDDYSWTPPYFPETSGSSYTPPGIASSVLNSILGAIIPSAEAGVTRPTGGSTVGSIAGAAASVFGGAAAAGAAAVGMVGRMSAGAAAALYTLRNRLTGLQGAVSTAALSSWGRKTYAQIASWVRANPGTSAITLLTGLGLTVEQAAHFMAWGATTKKRTRSRGISGRDIRNATRTIRRMANFNHRVQKFCGMIPHRSHHRRK